MISAAFRFAAITLLILAAGPARAADNLLTTPDAAARAVADIVAKIGHAPSVSLVEITDGATVAGLTAEKRITGLRPPKLVWIVDVADARGEKGKVVADTHGTILEIVEPESRQPKPEWLAGATIRATLDRIFDKFPKGAKFTSILINDDQAHVDAEDPVKPGDMASFIVDAQNITPFGRPFPPEVFGLESGPARMFTAEDMAGYDAATLDALKQRTLARINLQAGKVSRLTFERGNVFVASPHGKVLVEIRVEAGSRGGRVTYEPDGTELDVVLP
jgi:hypothetical protein